MVTKSSPSDDELIERYLLGRLDAKAAEAVENRIFSDDAFLDRAAIVETELMDRYASGSLSAVDRAAFQQYAATPAHRRRTDFARALHSRATAAAPMPSPRRYWNWIAVAAGVLLAVFIGYRYSEPYPATIAVTLTPGTLRSPDSVQTIRIAGAASIRIHWSDPRASRAEIRFVDTGAVVWTGPVDAGRSVVPAPALQAGDHTALTFDRSGQETADFAFRVERRPSVSPTP